MKAKLSKLDKLHARIIATGLERAAQTNEKNAELRRKFYNKEFFTKNIVPSMAIYAQRDGKLMQVKWIDGQTWQILNAVDQPTGRAFAFVDQYGEMTEGPMFDPEFR